jgi:NADP-dependent 3-hydroxy acid dehydrogenase YdfG
MTNNITGKVVVITGASGGLGEAIARHLVKLGAKVVLGARRIERLEKLVSEIKSENGNAVAAATDVTKRQDLERLASKAVEEFGRVDVLVNNAGIMQLASLAKLRVDEWDRMIDVNIKGVLYGIAAVLPLMNKQQSGHIINIASVGRAEGFRSDRHRLQCDQVCRAGAIRRASR